MRRLTLALLAALLLAGCLSGPSGLVVTLEAQGLPIALRVEWDRAAPSDPVVTSYIVTVDGIPATLDAATCSASGCAMPISFATLGSHTVSVAGTNDSGTGPAATITVNLVLPKAPTGLKVVK